MYGGKIDNEYDLKILDSLVSLYFNPKTYNLNYPLFKTAKNSTTQMLTIPERRNNAGYSEWIENLPPVESPEWSGLPNNAEKLLRELESRRFITEMNKIQGVEDEELIEGTSDKSKASWLTVVEAKAKRLFETLPGQVNNLEKSEQANKNPIFRFLKREIGVAGKLLHRVRNDLQKLIEMCQGNLKSTNDLREIARDIFNDSVPKNWRVYQTMELNVTEWVLDLRNRILQLNKISNERDFGKRNIWLGGLIFPGAYLTATRQYVAQSLKVPLDELVLNVELPKEITSIDEQDFIITGMCIEGAEWSYEQGRLIMTDNLYYQLPAILLRWTKKSNEISNKFYIPVYLNNTRKNLLFSVKISNESELSDFDWYQRGTALISWNKTYDYKN